jgi:cell division protein FtsI/penicillin-binding protein 2
MKMGMKMRGKEKKEMKEKMDEKMNRVKTGFILLLILLCSGIGVTAYVNHTSIL